MLRLLLSLGLAYAIAICGLIGPSASTALAAEGEARSKAGWPRPTRSVRPNEKVCRYKFSDGEKVVWICDKAVPCCEWEALNKYVKCGTTFTGCL